MYCEIFRNWTIYCDINYYCSHLQWYLFPLYVVRWRSSVHNAEGRSDETHFVVLLLLSCLTTLNSFYSLSNAFSYYWKSRALYWLHIYFVNSIWWRGKHFILILRQASAMIVVIPRIKAGSRSRVNGLRIGGVDISP